MNMHLLSSIFFIFLVSIAANASALEGILNKMSEGSYLLSKDSKSCGDYDPSSLSSSLTNFNEGCIEGILVTAKTINSPIQKIGKSLEKYIEDQFFNALGLQHVKELHCAEDLTRKISKGDEREPEYTFIEDTASKLRSLRKVRQELNDNVKLLSQLRTGSKICPLTLQQLDLDRNTSLKKSEDYTYTLCHKIISSRLTEKAIKLSIPYSNIQGPLNSLIDRYITIRDSEKAHELDLNLENILIKSYGELSRSFKAEKNQLKKSLKELGAQTFNRAEKRVLMSDSRVIQKIINSSNNKAELEQLSCQMDARYGRGAEKLDINLSIGSFAIGGVVGIAGKLAGRSWTLTRALSGARATGALSVNSVRLMKFGALSGAFSADMLAGFSDASGACFKKLNLSQKIDATTDRGDICVSTPKIEDRNKDNCILTATLGVLGVMGGVELANLLQPRAQAVKIITGGKNIDIDKKNEVLTSPSSSQNIKKQSKSLISSTINSTQSKLEIFKILRSQSNTLGLTKVSDFFNQKMIKENDELMVRIQKILKDSSIESRLIESPSGRGNLVLDIVPETINSGTPRAQKLLHRIQEKFGGEMITINLYENINSGATGFSQGKRIELGIAQAELLLDGLISNTAKHEARHLMFSNMRNKGISSIYSQEFVASGKSTFSGSTRGFYDTYMSAEEIYTHSTDIGSIAKKMIKESKTGNYKNLRDQIFSVIDKASGVKVLSNQTSKIIDKNLEVLRKTKLELSKGLLTVNQLEEILSNSGIEIWRNSVDIKSKDGVKTSISIDSFLFNQSTIFESIKRSIAMQESLKKVSIYQTAAASKLMIQAVKTIALPLKTNQEEFTRLAIEYSNNVKERYKKFVGILDD